MRVIFDVGANKNTDGHRKETHNVDEVMRYIASRNDRGVTSTSSPVSFNQLLDRSETVDAELRLLRKKHKPQDQN